MVNKIYVINEIDIKIMELHYNYAECNCYNQAIRCIITNWMQM